MCFTGNCPFDWARALRLADDAAESVICTEGHNTEGRQWVLYPEQIAADPSGRWWQRHYSVRLGKRHYSVRQGQRHGSGRWWQRHDSGRQGQRHGSVRQGQRHDYLGDCIAHLEWRGIAKAVREDDRVTVIFEEQ